MHEYEHLLVKALVCTLVCMKVFMWCAKECVHGYVVICVCKALLGVSSSSLLLIMAGKPRYLLRVSLYVGRADDGHRRGLLWTCLN